jgi:tetratricopeptide (TPR) repeat protein
MLAGWYDTRCNNTQHAVELLAEAIRLEPSNLQGQAELERLGEKGQHWARVIQALRLAAARVAPAPRALELARNVAGLYATRLQDQAASLEVHRWILQIWPDELASLQVIIEAQRAAGEHADLRTSLEQSIDRNPDTSRHVESWLEIGRLCRENLADQAGALVAYSHVIELDPANEEAIEALRGLGDVSLAPALRLKRIRVELARASGPKKIEMLQQLVALELEMGDRDAAIEALREMMTIEGGAEAAFEPLSKLLHEAGSWSELASLLENAAQTDPSAEGKLGRLRDALEQSEEHLQEPEREERLLRQLLSLSPNDDEAAVKLARLMRNAKRFEELAEQLSARLEAGTGKLSRAAARWTRRELVRLLDLALSRSKDAEALLRAKHDGDAAGHDPDDALWLAMIASRKPDHANYIEQRRRHIPKLPKRLGGMVLCHLAEYCDQYMKLKGRVLALYREARTLDPDNQLATDALRGLGRGVKTWRSTAALLQAPGEENLSNAERADKLRRLGDASRAIDAGLALTWYERAVAVNPDEVEAWDAIAALMLDRKETEYAWLASVEACHAFERVTSPLQSDVAALAMRLARTAEIAFRAEQFDEARELGEIAYAVDPNVPSSAMLVADARFEAGDDAEALSLYGHIIEHMVDSLAKEQRAHVLFRRGALALRAGDIDRAHQDLRAALQLSPLLSPALDAIADLLRKQAQPANAALHLLKALLVTREPDARGSICRRIGELFESELARPDEAGAWFETAVEAGVVDPALQRRLLQHYRRTGRAEQALSALEELISATSEPGELAELWAMRGSIQADTDLEAAVEALDIALSYDPGHAAALASLRSVLEQRGDFAQLADLLDARAEAGSHAERIEALRSLVRICNEHLQDKERGEQYLIRLVELAPSRESIEEVLRIVQADPARSAERLPLIGRILASGPPYCDRLLEAARLIYDSGDKHWAWAVLSAVLGAAPVDTWTKQALAELRKQFERFDTITLLRPFIIDAAGALPEPDPFGAALLDVCARLYAPTDEAGMVAVDARTGPGKLFERLQEALGVEGKLLRSPETAPTLVVVAGSVPTIAIRTDQLSAPPGELGWLCTYGLMLARSNALPLAVVPEAERRLIIPALATASSDGDAESAEVAQLANRLCEKLSADELKAWAAHLTDRAKAENDAAEAFSAMERAAARVAMVAAGDLRTASRAVARLTPDNRRPPGVGKLDDFEAFFASIPAIRWLFEFCVTEDFGRLIKASA